MVSRKEYTKAFKQEALRMAQEKGNKSQVVRDLGIHTNMLRRWEKQFAEQGEKAFPGKGHVQNEEIAQLQRENQRLQETVEILKKAVAKFSSRPRQDTSLSKSTGGSIACSAGAGRWRCQRAAATPGRSGL